MFVLVNAIKTNHYRWAYVDVCWAFISLPNLYNMFGGVTIVLCSLKEWSIFHIQECYLKLILGIYSLFIVQKKAKFEIMRSLDRLQCNLHVKS